MPMLELEREIELKRRQMNGTPEERMMKARSALRAIAIIADNTNVLYYPAIVNIFTAQPTPGEKRERHPHRHARNSLGREYPFVPLVFATGVGFLLASI